MDISRLLENHPRIILFDGVCVLCSAWVPFVHQRDPAGRYHFASVQSEAGQALLAWLGLPIDQCDTMVYIESGQAYYRSTAFLKIVRGLAGPWPLLGAGRLVPAFLRDWLYDRIALNRYRLFGKHETCMVPTPELAGRFVTNP